MITETNRYCLRESVLSFYYSSMLLNHRRNYHLVKLIAKKLVASDVALIDSLTVEWFVTQQFFMFPAPKAQTINNDPMFDTVQIFWKDFVHFGPKFNEYFITWLSEKVFVVSSLDKLMKQVPVVNGINDPVLPCPFLFGPVEKPWIQVFEDRSIIITIYNNMDFLFL